MSKNCSIFLFEHFFENSKQAHFKFLTASVKKNIKQKKELRFPVCLSKILNKMSFDTIPKDLRGLRACLVCSLVKVIYKLSLFGLF